MKKIHFILIFLVAVSLATAYGVRRYNQRDPVFTQNMVGKTAPAFSLPSSTGVKLALDDFQGKLILLNFWASWCPPCRAEIPGFIKTQNKYKDKPFTFIGVAIEDKTSVMEYAKEVGINYPITYGVEEAYKVASDYGDPDGALPYSILISPNKKILEVFAGFLSEDRLEKLINKNLSTN